MKAFDSQFVPAGDGYLFYAWKKSGGKLVTAAEYAELAEDWRRQAGWRRLAALVAISVVATLVWIAFSVFLMLPVSIGVGVAVAMTVVPFLPMLWTAYAPRRLVKDREVVAPPRDPNAVMRQARVPISWPYLLYTVVLGSWLVSRALTASEPGFLVWFPAAAGAGLLVATFWVAGRKLLDRRG